MPVPPEFPAPAHKTPDIYIQLLAESNMSENYTHHSILTKDVLTPVFSATGNDWYHQSVMKARYLGTILDTSLLLTTPILNPSPSPIDFIS